MNSFSSRLNSLYLVATLPAYHGRGMGYLLAKKLGKEKYCGRRKQER
jgi:hypothetical protein